MILDFLFFNEAVCYSIHAFDINKKKERSMNLLIKHFCHILSNIIIILFDSSFTWENPDSQSTENYKSEYFN